MAELQLHALSGVELLALLVKLRRQHLPRPGALMPLAPCAPPETLFSLQFCMQVTQCTLCSVLNWRSQASLQVHLPLRTALYVDEPPPAAGT